MLQFLLFITVALANAEEGAFPPNHLEDCLSRDREFRKVDELIKYRERNVGRGVDRKCAEAIAQAKQRCTDSMKADPEGPDLPKADEKQKGVAQGAQMQVDTLRNAGRAHQYHRGSCAEENEKMNQICGEAEKTLDEELQRNYGNKAVERTLKEDLEFTKWARGTARGAGSKSDHCDRAMEALYKDAEERTLAVRDSAAAEVPEVRPTEVQPPEQPQEEKPSPTLSDRVAEESAAAAQRAPTTLALGQAVKQMAPALPFMARATAVSALGATVTPSNTSKCDGTRYANPVAALNDDCYYRTNPTVTPQSIQRAIQILSAK